MKLLNVFVVFTIAGLILALLTLNENIREKENYGKRLSIQIGMLEKREGKLTNELKEILREEEELNKKKQELEEELKRGQGENIRLKERVEEIEKEKDNVLKDLETTKEIKRSLENLKGVQAAIIIELEENNKKLLEEQGYDEELAKNIKKEKISSEVLTILENKFDNEVNFILYDGEYNFLPLENWEKIIAKDKTDELVPEDDAFDCDNYAITFIGSVSARYKINVGFVLGTVEKEGKVEAHAWNALLVDNEGGVEIYFLEPQDDTLVKAEKTVTINGEKYTASTIRWY